MTAPARRALVRDLVATGLSERRALVAVHMSASALRYAPRLDGNVELRERIQALAQRHKRYGVGMIHLKLRQAGMLVNYKRVERLYQEARLQVRRRKRKKVPIGVRQPLLRPTAANQVWSMDFVFDRTGEGCVLKCLTIVDDATHEAVAIEVERAISGQMLTRVLDHLALSRGLPQVDPYRQRQGVLRQGDGRVGARARREPTTDRARQAKPERLRRVVQRPAARRMSQ